MGIFESLENLQVSESCFSDILRIVEAALNEKWGNNSGRRLNGDEGINDDSEDKYHVKKYNIAYHDREMSPDQYIKRATSIINKSQGSKYKPKAVENEKRSYTNNYSFDDLKNKIKDPNREIDRPYLDYTTGDQEGFHRAIASKDLGITKIPVRVFHATKKGGNRINRSK